MSIREEQCNKVCRILDDVLANRTTERDSLIVAVRKAFESLEQFGNSEPLPSAQPEIIRCKDCKWGAQDEVGRWFCRSLGCQIGNEDGSGYCADAERRTKDEDTL